MNKSLYIIGLTLVLASSCTERIDIELEDTYTRLVVEGTLTDEASAHRVILTTTSSYFENQPAPKVGGATVSITDGINTFMLKELQPGIYETDSTVKGEIGKTYTLQIEDIDINNDGKTEKYTATSKINPIAPLDSIDIEFRSDWGDIWTVKVYALDPPTTEYYMFNVYNNGVLLSDTIDEVIVTDDILFNGNYTNGIVSQWFEEDEGDIGDTITFEMASIRKEYADFLFQLQEETGYNSPLFSGPPANVQGNISNDALGFFAAYSIEQMDAIIKNK